MGDHADYYPTLFLFTDNITLTMKSAPDLGGIGSSREIRLVSGFFFFINRRDVPQQVCVP